MAGARGAVIVAAGASQRMGRPKALLPWAGTTLLDHAVRTARAAGVVHLAVVLGPATEQLAGTLDAMTVLNPRPESGRSTSIRFGAQALPDEVAAVLVQSVDQPAPLAVLTALFTALEAGGAVSLPVFGGRRGHPVCVAGRLLPELRRVDEAEEGLRSIVRGYAAQTVEVDVESESVLWNLNDPAAYAAAARASSARVGLVFDVVTTVD
jgi:molybdenum cofactor cytidylyltransferase